jgi:hypothetical protein
MQVYSHRYAGFFHYSTRIFAKTGISELLCTALMRNCISYTRAEGQSRFQHAIFKRAGTARVFKMQIPLLTKPIYPGILNFV